MKILRNTTIDTYILTAEGSKFSVYDGMEINDTDIIIGQSEVVDIQDAEIDNQEVDIEEIQ